MIALIVPWFLLLLLIIVVLCLILKRWKTSLLLLVVIIGANWWSECIPLSFSHKVGARTTKSFKVLSFNIDGSAGDFGEKVFNIKETLNKQSSDIIFITEFNERYPKALDSLLSVDYPFSTFSDRLLFNYFYGKQPFFKNRRLVDKNGIYVGVFACSTVIQGDTIDLYGCHFASNNYNEQLERLSTEDIKGQEGLFSYLKNIKTSGRRRGVEAETIAYEISKSSHNAIVLGDMNDVGGSYAISVLKTAGLKDAWWEGGFGYGATIHKPLSYRIDHIMHTNGLELQSIRVIDSNGVSDHNALYAEYKE